MRVGRGLCWHAHTSSTRKANLNSSWAEPYSPFKIIHFITEMEFNIKSAFYNKGYIEHIRFDSQRNTTWSAPWGKTVPNKICTAWQACEIRLWHILLSCFHYCKEIKVEISHNVRNIPIFSQVIDLCYSKTCLSLGNICFQILQPLCPLGFFRCFFYFLVEAIRSQIFVSRCTLSKSASETSFNKWDKRSLLFSSASSSL